MSVSLKTHFTKLLNSLLFFGLKIERHQPISSLWFERDILFKFYPNYYLELCSFNCVFHYSAANTKFTPPLKPHKNTSCALHALYLHLFIYFFVYRQCSTTRNDAFVAFFLFFFSFTRIHIFSGRFSLLLKCHYLVFIRVVKSTFPTWSYNINTWLFSWEWWELYEHLV